MKYNVKVVYGGSFDFVVEGGDETLVAEEAVRLAQEKAKAEGINVDELEFEAEVVDEVEEEVVPGSVEEGEELE